MKTFLSRTLAKIILCSEVLLVECRKCGHAINKIDNVYPEFKRELLKNGMITPDEGMGVYDIRCFKKLLKEMKDRSRMQEMLTKED